MGIGRALSSTYRTLKLARKSDFAEFKLYIKLVFLGFGLVGGIGFIVYFVASIVMLTAHVPNPNPSGASTP